jgi:replicative DNA helicase
MFPGAPTGLFESEGLPVPSLGPTLARVDALLDALAAETRQAADDRRHGRPLGPISGFPSLDRELGGAFSPGIHVLGAVPGLGKTALALQIAAGCGVPSIVASTELSSRDVVRRIIASATRTPLRRLQTGRLSPEEVVELGRRAATSAPGLAIADATQGGVDGAWLERAIGVMRGEGGHLLLVVDSLHSWVESISPGVDEYVALCAGIACLRRIAVGGDVAVLCIVERNRASMKGGGISAGAGSRKIEYSAETVLSLDRDDASPDREGRAPLTLTIEKNRRGMPRVKIPLLFDGPIQRFEEPGHGR